jgi:hypothetical protein
LQLLQAVCGCNHRVAWLPLAPPAHQLHPVNGSTDAAAVLRRGTKTAPKSERGRGKRCRSTGCSPGRRPGRRGQGRLDGDAMD